MYQRFKEEIKEAIKENNIVKKDVMEEVINRVENMSKENNFNEISDEVIIHSIEEVIRDLKQIKKLLVGMENGVLYMQTLNKIAILNAFLAKN